MRFLINIYSLAICHCGGCAQEPWGPPGPGLGVPSPVALCDAPALPLEHDILCFSPQLSAYRHEVSPVPELKNSTAASWKTPLATAQNEVGWEVLQRLKQQSHGDLLLLSFRILILALFSYTFDYSSHNAAEEPAVQPSPTGIHGHILKASLLQAPTHTQKKSNQTYFGIRYWSR